MPFSTLLILISWNFLDTPISDLQGLVIFCICWALLNWPPMDLIEQVWWGCAVFVILDECHQTSCFMCDHFMWCKHLHCSMLIESYIWNTTNCRVFPAGAGPLLLVARGEQSKYLWRWDFSLRQGLRAKVAKLWFQGVNVGLWRCCWCEEMVT